MPDPAGETGLATLDLGPLATEIIIRMIMRLKRR